MEVATLILLFAGGLLSGAITAIAGGGSFLTFPMLLAAGLLAKKAVEAGLRVQPHIKT